MKCVAINMKYVDARKVLFASCATLFPLIASAQILELIYSAGL